MLQEVNCSAKVEGKEQKSMFMTQQHPFKRRHFQAEIIHLRVRWYVRYPLRYRQLEEMMLERGLSVAEQEARLHIHHVSLWVFATQPPHEGGKSYTQPWDMRRLHEQYSLKRHSPDRLDTGSHHSTSTFPISRPVYQVICLMSSTVARTLHMASIRSDTKKRIPT